MNTQGLNTRPCQEREVLRIGTIVEVHTNCKGYVATHSSDHGDTIHLITITHRRKNADSAWKPDNTNDTVPVRYASIKVYVNGDGTDLEQWTIRDIKAAHPEIRVKFSNGQEFTARVVGSDHAFATIRSDRDVIPPFEFEAAWETVERCLNNDTPLLY